MTVVPPPDGVTGVVTVVTTVAGEVPAPMVLKLVFVTTIAIESESLRSQQTLSRRQW